MLRRRVFLVRHGDRFELAQIGRGAVAGFERGVDGVEILNKVDFGPVHGISFFWTGSAIRKLAAVFIDRHGGSGGDIVGKGHAPDGDFDDRIEQGEAFIGKPFALGTDHERGLGRKRMVGKRCGVGGLFQPDQRIALLPELPQYGRQAVPGGEEHMLRAVAGNAVDEPSVSGGNDFAYPAATRRADDGGEVNMAAQRAAGNQKAAFLQEVARRFVAYMFEFQSDPALAMESCGLRHLKTFRSRENAQRQEKGFVPSRNRSRSNRKERFLDHA